jgi:hypothetical protein
MFLRKKVLLEYRVNRPARDPSLIFKDLLLNLSLCFSFVHNLYLQLCLSNFNGMTTTARINSEKHGVTFQEAKSVFYEEFADQFFDKKILTKRIAFFSSEEVFTPEF